MATRIVVDTDILIDAGRGDIQALQFLEQRQQSALAVSAITVMELLVGCRNKAEVRAIDQFISRFQVLNVNDAVSERAVALVRRYRLSHGLLIPDAVIAATAIIWNASLASKNQRDYRFIEELVLLPYPA